MINDGSVIQVVPSAIANPSPIGNRIDPHVGRDADQRLCVSYEPYITRSPGDNRAASVKMLFSLASVGLLVSAVWATTPGVELVVQQLLNSSGTNYPTSFTRDIVPVSNPGRNR